MSLDPSRPSWKTVLRLLIGLTALAALLSLAVVGVQRFRMPRVRPLADKAPLTVLKKEDLHAPGDKPLTIQLRGVAAGDGRFSVIPVVIYQSKNRLNQMKQAVLAYLEGPRQGPVRVPGPPGMVLNELYFSSDGTAVVDLSLPSSDVSGFGFWEEALFVRGLLFVLNNHFPEIRRARLLMDGKESGTLASHYALGSPASSYARPGVEVRPPE